MAQIFISYAREDRETAERLAQALERCGWTVWWDRHIPAGRRFDEVIAERLAGADCVLVLWSQRAIRSEWVIEEAETARERKALVPAMIETVEPPLGFRRIHAADLIGWDGTTVHAGFNQLVKDVDAVLQRGATSRLAFPPASSEPVVLSVDERAIKVQPDATQPALVWDMATIQKIEQCLTQYIGPIARLIVAKAAREAADLAGFLDRVSGNIPIDTDRQAFAAEAKTLLHGGAPGKDSASTPPANAQTATAIRSLQIADAGLGEIEKALARHIGPIAKVVVKRAVAQSGSAAELCASLLSHIEQEDDRRQFRAAVARWV